MITSEIFTPKVDIQMSVEDILVLSETSEYTVKPQPNEKDNLPFIIPTEYLLLMRCLEVTVIEQSNDKTLYTVFSYKRDAIGNDSNFVMQGSPEIFTAEEFHSLA